MTDTEQEITVEECTAEIKLMARRTALLHYYFSEAILAELGEEKGRQLILKAITAYGAHCGRTVREGVEAMGLPLTDENYGMIRDLPKYGWEEGMLEMPDGGQRPVASYCPLAAVFKELGPRGMQIGRLYCYVDQAKYAAYNPDIVFTHARNLLDGDECCEFLTEPRQKEG